MHKNAKINQTAFVQLITFFKHRKLLKKLSLNLILSFFRLTKIIWTYI